MAAIDAERYLDDLPVPVPGGPPTLIDVWSLKNPYPFHLLPIGKLLITYASVIAGALWDVHGPTATFAAGAVFTTLALAGVAIVWARLARPANRET